MSAIRSRSTSVNRCVRGVSMLSAVQGACSRSATRLAWRTRPTARGSSLTQTRTRSQAGQGPGMARACISVSNCSSTRSAVRRSASSRRAVRLAGEKKCSSARSGLLGDVDLAVLQPLDEVVGREIDELHCVRPIEDRVRHGLADADAGNLRDDVVQAVDVLDVDGRVDVDAVVQQLFDVEIALGMAAPRRIGVGELVDEHDLRPSGDDRIEVHLLELTPFVLDDAARDDFQPLEQRFRFFAPVRLDDPDDDIVAVLLSGPRRLQHLIGLADPGSGSHEYSELADAPVLSARGLEQGLRRRTLLQFLDLVCHRDPCCVPSTLDQEANALTGYRGLRFNDSTLTRGSPSKPRVRPSTWSATSCFRRSCAQTPRLGNTRHLEQGRFRRDVGVKAAARGRHEVDRDRGRRILLLQLLDVGLHALDQCLVRRARGSSPWSSRHCRARHIDLVGSAGSGAKRRRRAPVEVAVAGEGLANELRADDLAALPIRLPLA